MRCTLSLTTGFLIGEVSEACDLAGLLEKLSEFSYLCIQLDIVNDMPKASKPSPAIDSARRQAVIYARVSSKEQEKEGFSIPAQLKLLKEYAAANGFAIVQEYVERCFSGTL